MSGNFDTPFTLKLFAATLYSALVKPNLCPSARTPDKSVAHLLVDDSIKIQNKEEQTSKGNGNDENNEKTETLAPNQEKEESVLCNKLVDGIAQDTVKNVSEIISDNVDKSNLNNTYSSDDSNKETDRNQSKKIFFNSDSDLEISDDESDDDSSSSSSLKMTKQRAENSKCNNLTFHSVKKNVGDNKEDDNDELTKLLRLANKSLATDTSSYCQKSNEKSSEKKTAEKKSKNESQNLLDFLSKDGSIENKSEVVKISPLLCEEENLEDQINYSVKKAFLLSSDECEISENDEQNEAKHLKKKKFRSRQKIKQENSGDSENTEAEEKKQKNDEKIGTKDGLKRFNLLNLSSTEGETVDYESDDTKISVSSSSSGKSETRRKMKKKEFLSEVTLSGSSDSDIQKIPIAQSKVSPIKGRKNINKILKKDFLEIGTKQARKLEAERKKRIAERKKILEKFTLSLDNSKLVLDFDPNTKEELVVVDSKLCQKLKPHQRNGVQFMWDSCFESLDRLEHDSGSGCILAHCMGLGKTLQVITLIHTVFNHDTGVKSVIILCPLNTVKNWLKEFKIWLSKCNNKIVPFQLLSCKSEKEKADKITAWGNLGGVLVLSYEMFRSLMNSKKPQYKTLYSFLCDPGPDLVVCDEGHLLKNMKTALSQRISEIKTLRRIVLTGTPLQNNLIEYYCMVQFVKPNILGTMKEFMNGFVNPIKNGQFEDSTQLDVLLMKRRSHVLHSLLEGFIQRLGYYVLKPLLPEKQEYVIKICLTPAQDRLYRLFVENISKNNVDSSRSGGLLDDFHWLQKIWTHPIVVLEASKREMLKSEKCRKMERHYENWGKLVKKEEYEDFRSSGKLVLLFKILKICRQMGDKILVFSQYLSTLDLIEHFLHVVSRHNKKEKENFQEDLEDSWILGLDYFRIDGSINTSRRFEYCKKFNDVQQKRSRLLLISTRSGGMGINLVGANRVIVFDVSWNPSHDLQSIFRIYRFGQVKPCYIYRFLAEATIEEKIYKRQVTKLSLAHRILDEHQIERHYSMTNLHELYSYNPTPKSCWTIPIVPKDSLFAKILSSSRDIIVGYHEHDSLLENKEEEELTEEERRAAWEDYEKERFQPLGFLSSNSTGEMGSSYSVMNRELHHMINMYKDGLLASQKDLVFNESEQQMCKIVDVRTLQIPRTFERNFI